MPAFTFHAPGSADALADVERQLDRQLPAEYKRFMLEHDGGEGTWGLVYLVMWRIDELVLFNDDYEVSTYAPGLFLFGSNGGGKAFAFDLRASSPLIKVVPLIGMSHQDAMPVAPDFEAFLERLKTRGIA